MGWARWLLLGDLGQQMDIEDVRGELDRLRAEHDRTDWDAVKVREVAEELLELQVRHGLLVRLLIRKGLITAEEYAGLISAARVKPADKPEG
jgi:uncharacterized protein CbrC (UPF0167 family)